MKKNKGKGNPEICDLFSFQQFKAEDASRTQNVVCIRAAGSKLRATRDAKATKDAIAVILERAKKLDW